MKNYLSKIRTILAIIFILECNVCLIAQNENAKSNNSGLDNKKIIRLHKNDKFSPKILAGVANVRFKSVDTVRFKSYTVIENNFQSLPNTDFAIIEPYLNSKQLISSQKERFQKYSKKQQEIIKDLEEKLQRTFIIEFDENINVLSFCRKMKEKEPNIEYIEPYFVPEPQEKPNDPLIDDQSVLFTIKAFDAWNICEGSEDVLIGISDSGVNWDHLDMKDAVAINQNETINCKDSDNNGYVDDYYGYNFAWRSDGDCSQYNVYNQNYLHGTQVAGIIAARVNNGIGIAGVSNKCKIVPIKIVAKNGGYIYAYQSMIYAAVRGCKVLNCSWGNSGSYSITEQTIVDYATACDVAIVASGGNLSWGNRESTFFPASYFGVLGVGESNANDRVSATIVGTGTRIVAQGVDNYTISGTSGYVKLGTGSSFSAPVVAGIVGILRSYRPELTALEALEIVRITADNIRNIAGNANDNYKNWIPTRANMLNALELVKFDDEIKEIEMPSIILKDYYFENKDGQKQERFFENDTAILVLNLQNVLGDAKDISIELVELYTVDANAFTVLNSEEIYINEIKSSENYLLKDLKIVFKKPTSNFKVYYQVKISGKTKSNLDFSDDFKLYLFLLDNCKTFYNEKLTISAFDNGMLGYNVQSQYDLARGLGFTNNKLRGGDLPGAGIVAVANSDKVISANLDVNSINGNDNSFEVVKGLYGNAPNVNILKDSRTTANNRIGVEIAIKYEFPTDTSSAIKMNLKAKNISGQTINDFVLGQFYDWDIFNSDRNRVKYFSEAIPSDLGSDFAAAEMITDEDESIFIGSLVYFDKNKYPTTVVTPQSAGVINIFQTKQIQIDALTNGINLQTDAETDVAYYVGMRLLNAFEPNFEFECEICTAIESTKELLVKSLLDCYEQKSNIISNATESKPYSISILNSNIVIQLKDNEFIGSNVEIYNYLGSKVLETKLSNIYNIIDISNLNNNFYFIKLSNSKIFFEKIIGNYIQLLK